MKIKYRVLIVFALLAAAVTAAVFKPETKNAMSDSRYGENTVLIDPGHGGADGGAVSVSGVKESEYNLEISLRLAEILRRDGYNVILTRSEDVSLADSKKEDMKKRRSLIESSGQEVTVSIHQNFISDSSCVGPQVFYDGESKDSERFAALLQDYLNCVSNNERKREAKPADYYIVKSGKKPVVIIECGFISNENEEQLLKMPGYQLKIANAVAGGIKKWLDSEKSKDEKNINPDIT